MSAGHLGSVHVGEVSGAPIQFRGDDIVHHTREKNVNLFVSNGLLMNESERLTLQN